MTASRRVVAAGFGGPENLQVEQIDPVEPGPGQVRVSVRAAGVNAYDAKVYAGPGDHSRLPIRLGYEAAGVVNALGDNVTGWSPGDEVIVFPASGAYASDLVVEALALTAKPASLPWAEAAALLLTGAAAWHALEAAHVGRGDVVLVHGASGGVGLYAVQLATLRGARVIATAGHQAHPLLRQLGAEPVVYGDGLLSRARELVPPAGADAALDLVGTDEAMDVSLALVTDRSRVVSIANFDRAPREGVTLLGNGPGADPGTEIRNAARTELARLAGEGKLRVFVESTYPLDDAVQAHRRIATGHTTGKLVLLP
jgi:NADPH:quinone reductase-like Zn-dependent oxidoreductase